MCRSDGQTVDISNDILEYSPVLKAMLQHQSRPFNNIPPSQHALPTVIVEDFSSAVLREVVRFLNFKKAHMDGVSGVEFQVDKDLAVDVLLASSYFQIE